MPGQARNLVAKMKASSDVDMDHDWKLVTLFIGGNDLCQYCGNEVHDITNSSMDKKLHVQ